MRSWRPFCCGWPGLIRSMAMPRRNHQTDSLERLNRALGLAKGTPLSERMAAGRPRSRKSCAKAVMAVSSRVAEQQEARGVIGGGQGVTVVTVAELELALEVGAPQVVGRDAGGQWRAAGPRPRAAQRLDQTVPMQDGMDGALGRDAQVAVQTAHQQFPNLARTPMGLLALESDDETLDLGRQLIGIAYRSARAVAQRLAPMLLIPREDLVAGLAGDAKLPAHLRHRFAVEQLDDKS